MKGVGLVKTRLAGGIAVLCLLVAVAGGSAAQAGGHHKANAADPCAGPGSAHLLCPNLRIGPPSDLYVQRSGGRVLLRATSDVRSRGRGPMELRGKRNGRRSMRVDQRIYRAGGGHIDLRTRATLHFTDVGAYFGGRYWKVHQLARFELWSVDHHHRLVRRVRTGPKLNYCLRDLERTRPGRRSPSYPHYPGCNQNPSQNRVTLGTSVGWSDIYPADYSKQWIPVKGLHGCFAFVMRVDPNNLLYESNEHDNTSRRLVHLPFHGDTGC
jgi:Lysyl oxidase